MGLVPAAARYLPIIAFLVFALAERKNEKRLKSKVPLKSATLAQLRDPDDVG
jgi:hypothetical protein